MHKKTAPSFVHYGEPEKIEKSFAFNVDIFTRDVIPKRDVTKHRRFFIIKLTVYREAVPGKTMEKEF